MAEVDAHGVLTFRLENMTADLRRIGEKAEHIEQPGLPGGPACGDGQRPLDLGLQHVAQQIVDVFVMVIKGIARQPAVLDDIADGDLVQRLDGQKCPERLGDGALGDLLLSSGLSFPCRAASGCSGKFLHSTAFSVAHELKFFNFGREKQHFPLRIHRLRGMGERRYTATWNKTFSSRCCRWAGTLTGTLGGILTSARLTNYRIEQLEKKVDRHNGFGERIPVLEDRVTAISHRMDCLEGGKT